MALTLTTTLSSPVANSYVDIAYCDAYWGQHFSTTRAEQWSSLSESQKTFALIQACRVLETLRFTTPGTGTSIVEPRLNKRSHLIVLTPEPGECTKAVIDQALQFPRGIDLDRAGAYFVPEPIKLAQCEQAVHLLTADYSAIEGGLQGVRSESMKAGDVSVSTIMTGMGSSLAPMALEYVRPFLLKVSSRIGRG